MGKQKSVTIGYKYFMGVHMAMCHGPVDAILKILVGDREAWSGNVTSSSRIYINAPGLFGGEKKEGGIVGYVDLAFGEATQAKNPYLQSVLGNVIPAFRGVTSAIANKVYLAAMSPYPKPWSFVIQRLAAKTWQPSFASINGSANGVHIIYEALTSYEWGMGYPSTSINLDSFAAAAQTCFNENLGISMTLSAQETIEAFIQIVLGHINAVLYTEPDTGRFALKMLRDNYNVATLKHFDENNVVKLDSFERPSPAEMINEVVVVYRPRGTHDDDSVTVQDLASVQAQYGVISTTKQYPGIDNATNASRIALRDLRQVSTPLARVLFSVNREGWDLTVGDVVTFSWAALGISSLILRILKLSFGESTTGYINIESAEDVFGLPSATYLSPDTRLWVEPSNIAGIAANRVVIESPYWEVARSVTEADAAYFTDTSAFIIALAARPLGQEFEYDLVTSVGASPYEIVDTAVFCPMVPTLLATNKIQTSFSIGFLLGDIDDIVIGGYAFIDNEAIRIDAINVVLSTLTAGRGCLDTVPETHLAGSKIYFATEHYANDRQEYVTGETVNVKLTPRTQSNALALASAPTNSVLTKQRYASPYAPGLFKINGVSYPVIVEIASGTPLVVSWAHRDRLLQLATIIDTTAGSIGPEPSTTYSVRAYLAATNTLLQTLTGITTTSATLSLPTGVYDVEVQVESKRGTLVSWQKHSHIFTYSNPTATRITEDSLRRVTETLDVRVEE